MGDAVLSRENRTALAFGDRRWLTLDYRRDHIAGSAHLSDTKMHVNTLDYSRDRITGRALLSDSESRVVNALNQ